MQRDDRARDRQTREHPQVPRALRRVRAPLVEQRPPGHRAESGAEAEEGQRRLGQDGLRGGGRGGRGNRMLARS